jgi:hypothetical protein
MLYMYSMKRSRATEMMPTGSMALEEGAPKAHVTKSGASRPARLLIPASSRDGATTSASSSFICSMLRRPTPGPAGETP